MPFRPGFYRLLALPFSAGMINSGFWANPSGEKELILMKSWPNWSNAGWEEVTSITRSIRLSPEYMPGTPTNSLPDTHCPNCISSNKTTEVLSKEPSGKQNFPKTNERKKPHAKFSQQKVD